MGPSITKGLKDAEALEGIPFELTCEAVATPKPEITWFLIYLLAFCFRVNLENHYLFKALWRNPNSRK